MTAWQGSTRRARLPKDWPAIRRRILARDAGICHVCRQPGADDVDHLRAGDDHSDANLAAIHRRPCHARKSGQEGARASNARRVREKRPAEPHPGLVR